MKRLLAALVLPGCMISASAAQMANLNPSLPKVGTRAPAVTFTKLLQAPAGTKAALSALHGKVVVLEFWATWCAPCVGEIPVLNALAASLDPAKVQFISVDDQDPAVVEAFLKKKSISGWVGLDSTGAMFKRYGVEARPATIVIGPDGRVVSTSVHPENLQREKLLALAQGKKTEVGGKADPKIEAEINANVQKAFAEQIGKAAGSADALFELRLTASEVVKDGPKPETHMMMFGPGKMDITYGDIQTLLTVGTGLPKTRLTVDGVLPKTMYNLHVNAPNLESKELNEAIELAIVSATKLKIEHKTTDSEAYVLTALPEHKAQPAPAAHGGFAFYDGKKNLLRCVSATVDQVASALEEAVGKPVVNETGLDESVSADIPIPSKDVAGANAMLGKELELTLKPARRPIERVLLSSPAVGDSAEKLQEPIR